jgi:glycosyltransferase involved in cell wall biosynthesis
MRICVISTPVFQIRPPNGTTGYSGLEVLAYQQAAGLAKLGHQVALVAPDGSECPGVEMIHIGPAGQVNEEHAYSGFPEIKMGWQTVRTAHLGYWQQLLRFDAIIDNSWQKHSYALKTEGRLKAPVLGVCHAPINTMFRELPRGVEKPCFVCISDDQRNHFENLFNRPARTCYNGIDLNFYKPLNVPRSNRFLFLARFSTIKGPDIAIAACKKAGVGLDLVGDTQITNEPELLAQCQSMCDGEQIRLVGPATRGECVWWFSQARCLLHPNERFREPFGLAPVEAMACGCPVIAWDNGAMRETITNDGIAGVLVHSFDELVSAIRNMAENNESLIRSTSCRKQAEKFSVERMVSRYAELCTEAIATGGW